MKKDTRHTEHLNFSPVPGYHKTGSSLIALNITRISEGKERFTHHGTHDHLDEFPQSIVNNSCTVRQLIYELVSYTPHAVTPVKL